MSRRRESDAAADIDDAMRISVVKPLLRWAGSKQSIAGRLLELAPRDYGTYHEPFLGSGALFFAMQPQRAILSDIIADLILLYDTVAIAPLQLAAVLEGLLPDSDLYYQLRCSLKTQQLSKIERAAAFFYLNRYCYNGLYRTNRDGHFNVPYSGYKTGGLPNSQRLSDAAVLLSRATIMVSDFEEALSLARPGDFVFLDPPYFSSEKRTHTEYASSRFGPPDLARLLDTLRHLDRSGVQFLLTFHTGLESLPLTKKWNTTCLDTRRVISCDTATRNIVTEVCVRNYA